MSEDDHQDFRSRLQSLINIEHVNRVLFGLQNGDRLLVQDPIQIVVKNEFITIYEPDGNIVVFPVESICVAQILVLEE